MWGQSRGDISVSKGKFRELESPFPRKFKSRVANFFGSQGQAGLLKLLALPFAPVVLPLMPIPALSVSVLIPMSLSHIFVAHTYN